MPFAMERSSKGDWTFEMLFIFCLSSPSPDSENLGGTKLAVTSIQS